VNEVINIEEKFSLFSDYLSPKRIEMLNGQQIILAKLKGEFVFHKHDHEDELFMVIKGQLILELKDKTVVVNPGEFYTVPRGVEHKPTAKEETHLLLFEPLETKHTGDVTADITVEEYEEI
jgi:mannose-6-phosphate isomerase-like protein (cupin superfamily)